MLTAKQIERYNLPRSPDKGATELDALESLHPGVLRQIVQRGVREWRDPTFARRMDEARSDARALVDETMARFVDDLEQLTQRVDAALGEARSRYQEAIEAIKAGNDAQELESLAIEAANALLELDLPERPTPEVDDLADDWLFRSDRSYMEQLDFYKDER